MASVFVIQDAGRLDFSDARRYGELVPMIERDVFPDDVEERVPAMRRILTAKLTNFDPYRDFVLLTGDPIAIVLASQILFDLLRCPAVQFLKWDAENRKYYHIQVSR